MVAVSKKTTSPLVTVVVVSYNSSQTIVETLDSIYNQSYKNIELIVSDDCSTDETADIVRKWLEEKGSRFVNSELVTTSINTGVSGNVNRGVAKSNGEWIKSIAGDDLLVPEGIDEYVRFVQSHDEEVRMCVCDVEPFSEQGEVPENIIESYKRFFERENETYEQQRKRVMTSLVFIGPAYFYSKELFEEIGGFSEKYGCAEEWPFVYKVIRGGNRIYCIKKKLVRYRVQANSLCHSNKKEDLGNKRVFMGMYHHFFDHAFKDLIKEGYILLAWHHALFYWSRRLQYKTQDNQLRRIIGKLLMMLSPLSYYHLLVISNED